MRSSTPQPYRAPRRVPSRHVSFPPPNGEGPSSRLGSTTGSFTAIACPSPLRIAAKATVLQIESPAEASGTNNDNVGLGYFGMTSPPELVVDTSSRSTSPSPITAARRIPFPGWPASLLTAASGKNTQKSPFDGTVSPMSLSPPASRRVSMVHFGAVPAAWMAPSAPPSEESKRENGASSPLRQRRRSGPLSGSVLREKLVGIFAKRERATSDGLLFPPSTDPLSLEEELSRPLPERKRSGSIFGLLQRSKRPPVESQFEKEPKVPAAPHNTPVLEPMEPKPAFRRRPSLRSPSLGANAFLQPSQLDLDGPFWRAPPGEDRSDWFAESRRESVEVQAEPLPNDQPRRRSARPPQTGLFYAPDWPSRDGPALPTWQDVERPRLARSASATKASSPTSPPVNSPLGASPQSSHDSGLALEPGTPTRLTTRAPDPRPRKRSLDSSTARHRTNPYAQLPDWSFDIPGYERRRRKAHIRRLEERLETVRHWKEDPKRLKAAGKHIHRENIRYKREEEKIVAELADLKERGIEGRDPREF